MTKTTVDWDGVRLPLADEVGQQPATVEDLILVDAFFKKHNIPYWLHGGWVVESMLGYPIPHEDVDVFTTIDQKDRIKQAICENLAAEYPNRLAIVVGNCKVDVACVSPYRLNKYILVHPSVIWIFPQKAFGNEIGVIGGREFPIVSPYIVYMEQENTVWKKKKVREKFKERVRQLNEVVAPEDIAESRKWWPKKNNTINRLLCGVRM